VVADAVTVEDALAPELLGRGAPRISIRDEVEIRHAGNKFLIKALVVGKDEAAHLVFLVPLPGYPLNLEGLKAIEADFSDAIVEAQTDGRYRVRLGHSIVKTDLPSFPKATAYLEAKKRGASDDEAFEASARAA
jgi:hypothetical protein